MQVGDNFRILLNDKGFDGAYIWTVPKDSFKNSGLSEVLELISTKFLTANEVSLKIVGAPRIAALTFKIN